MNDSSFLFVFLGLAHRNPTEPSDSAMVPSSNIHFANAAHIALISKWHLLVHTNLQICDKNRASIDSNIIKRLPTCHFCSCNECLFISFFLIAVLFRRTRFLRPVGPPNPERIPSGNISFSDTPHVRFFPK